MGGLLGKVADVIIIGGGIVGTSIAAFLSEKGLAPSSSFKRDFWEKVLPGVAWEASGVSSLPPLIFSSPL